MKSNTRLRAALVAAAVVFASPSFGQQAQTQAPSAESLLMRAKRPGDTLAQYLDARRREFRMFDIDGDGAITETDLTLQRQINEAGARASAITTLLQSDFDGDGVVTRAEFEQLFIGNPMMVLFSNGREKSDVERKQFQAAIDKFMEPDSNGDGRIDSAEMLAYGEKRAIRYSGNPLQWVVMTLDENKDGRVSLDEYLKAAETAFR